jgi:hypothetical protein
MRLRLIAFAVAMGASLGAHAQNPPAGLAPLDALLGTWKGLQEGQPGKGTVERTYSRILQARFIEGRNLSVYAPQEKNPKGERHENIDVFSFDNARKRIVLRQFHQEGFVNQYVMEPVTKAGTLVFVSEAIENIPPGYRARETYTLTSADEFEELFEIAAPGKDFETYSRARLSRVK